MGKQWFKRPLQIVSTEASASAGSQTYSGTMTVSKTFTASSRPALGARQTASTTNTVLTNYGVSSIARKSSAGASTQTYTLAAPTAVGLEKTIFAIDAGSTRTCRVTLTAASFHSSGNSTTLTKLTFNAGNDCVRLLSVSTTKWLIVSNVGSVTIA